MHPKKIICALVFYISTGAVAFSANNKDSLGLPGDNLDLYGVLDLFKKSANPEEFEKALNAKDNGLNNLDLNGDGYIDYINVEDHAEKNAHALILQIAVNEKEIQDVAVIEVERNEDGTAHIQVEGDEALYGKNYIIEPTENETAPPAPQPAPAPATVVMVNVWGWPTVRYMYEPHYVVWASPWRWRHYPVWFAPWRPLRWGLYYGNVYHYHTYHQRVFVNRVVYAHTIYYGHRSYSPTVYRHRSGMGRTTPPVNHQRSTPLQPVNHPRSTATQPINHQRSTTQHPVAPGTEKRVLPSPNQSHSGERSPNVIQPKHSQPRPAGGTHSGARHSGGAHHNGGRGR